MGVMICLQPGRSALSKMLIVHKMDWCRMMTFFVTFACKCSFLVIIIIIIIIIILFFSGHAIVIANLQNRITFSHQTPLIHGPLSDTLQRAFRCWSGITILDLEPDPCFKIFLNISKTNYRIFNCNMSNRRSGQELPFIFFELRVPTCLWGRYDPKTENFTLFYIYLLHIHYFSKTF